MKGSVTYILDRELLLDVNTLKVVEESRNAKEMMGWLEGKIKECKVTFDKIDLIFIWFGGWPLIILIWFESRWRNLFCWCDNFFRLSTLVKFTRLPMWQENRWPKNILFCPCLNFMFMKLLPWESPTNVKCWTMSFSQRREYKSKFLEVETEASRTKDRLEMMNHILDEMQEKM